MIRPHELTAIVKSLAGRVWLKRIFGFEERFALWRESPLFPRVLRFAAIWSYLLIVFLIDLEFLPGYNVPIFYVIPVLLIAMFEPPRYVATIGVLTLSMQLLEVRYEQPPLSVWPVTLFASLVVCSIAIWLAEQRQPERERQQTLARSSAATKAVRHRVLVLLGYIHLLEIAPTLSPQMQDEIHGRVEMESQELKSILEDLEE